MRYNKYFNEKKKELNDTTILKDLKEASKEYEDGAILECRDILVDIANAIDLFRYFYEEEE